MHFARLPNGSRLSCAASEKMNSFPNLAPRQLQALVRLRQDGLTAKELPRYLEPLGRCTNWRCISAGGPDGRGAEMVDALQKPETAVVLTIRGSSLGEHPST